MPSGILCTVNALSVVMMMMMMMTVAVAVEVVVVVGEPVITRVSEIVHI